MSASLWRRLTVQQTHSLIHIAFSIFFLDFIRHHHAHPRIRRFAQLEVCRPRDSAVREDCDEGGAHGSARPQPRHQGPEQGGEDASEGHQVCRQGAACARTGVEEGTSDGTGAEQGGAQTRGRRRRPAERREGTRAEQAAREAASRRPAAPQKHARGAPAAEGYERKDARKQACAAACVACCQHR